jgi:hypothetical protein
MKKEKEDRKKSNPGWQRNRSLRLQKTGLDDD